MKRVKAIKWGMKGFTPFGQDRLKLWQLRSLGESKGEGLALERCLRGGESWRLS